VQHKPGDCVWGGNFKNDFPIIKTQFQNRILDKSPRWPGYTWLLTRAPRRTNPECPYIARNGPQIVSAQDDTDGLEKRSRGIKKWQGQKMPSILEPDRTIIRERILRKEETRHPQKE
jgi:hypothetical protein